MEKINENIIIKKEKNSVELTLDKILPDIRKLLNIPIGMYRIIQFEFDNGQISKIIKLKDCLLISAVFTLGLSTLYYSDIYVNIDNVPNDKINFVHELMSALRMEGIDIYYDK